MSEMKDRLRADLTTAIKARESLTATVLRSVLTAISNAEVAGKQTKELTDDDVMTVLISEAKKRREAAEAFETGDRPELAAKEREEAVILSRYLPQPLSDEELQSIVAEAIAELGVAGEGMRAMGKVMGTVTPQTKGRADGGAVSAEVKRQLGA